MGKSKAKQTQSKVKSKIEAIKKINDSPTQTIGDTFDIFKTKTSLENGAIARKVDDYKDKTKAKKTEDCPLARHQSGFQGTYVM